MSDKRIEEYWGLRSDSYSNQNMQEMNSWKREAWRKKILSAAPAGQHLKILDVGTGPAFFAINLALAGHDVTAIDVTSQMLDHARANAEAYQASVRFMQMSGDQLDFPDASFDLVVNRNVLWNMENPKKALSEWKRVLRPGGRIVYFDANWYLYLFDQETALRREAGHKAAWEKYPDKVVYSADMPREKVEMLESVARELPLSAVCRPQWDRDILSDMGLQIVAAEEDVAPDVLDEWEGLMYQADPVFMICAEKVS